jgi:threonine dehydrogenase-like Zn-dependent dehydrogenase
VGTDQATATAFAVARLGSTVGIVGVPHGQIPFASACFGTSAGAAVPRQRGSTSHS